MVPSGRRGTEETPRALAPVLAVLRGVWAVARVLGGALAALVSAAVGTPPAWLARLGRQLADEYRAGRVGAIDAEIVHDPHDHIPPPTAPTGPHDDRHDGRQRSDAEETR